MSQLTFEMLPQMIGALTEEIKNLRRDFDEWRCKSSPASPQEERLIGIEEATVLLNRSTDTVYKWVRAGKIPYYKPGKMLEFRPSELMEYQKRSRNDRSKTTGELLKELSADVRRKPKSFGNIGM
ncbi:MAG: helix-turn-helix domain-containing protein [Muribaculaceae bacterium]|nr:helix-turn-helix domain-containing protein [Muribaculaceae bacterium]